MVTFAPITIQTLKFMTLKKVNHQNKILSALYPSTELDNFVLGPCD